MRFSERKGYKSISDVIQLDSMDDNLRNSLWNVLDLLIWKEKTFIPSDPYVKPSIEIFSNLLWFGVTPI